MTPADRIAHLRDLITRFSGDARLAALPPEQLIEALLILLGAGHLEPCPVRREEAVAEAASQAAWHLNQAILAQARDHNDNVHLAAPVIGGAVQIDRSSQLFLLAGSDDFTAWLWAADTGATLAVLTGHSGAVRCGGFLPDGRRAACTRGGGRARGAGRIESHRR